MGSVLLPGRIRSPRDPCGCSSVAHLTGATDDRAINLGAFNAPTPPKSRDSDLPRKEVIQPHLPVRLPCYDFTPLTGHSFGASVPYGFGQRLREQQIQVM